jgi:thiol-disulfide isomerase/thioredoxin
VAIGVVILFFVFDADAVLGGGAGSQLARRGEPAPDFVLDNLSGRQIHLTDFQGQVVVINFWATWCGPCVREIPMFEEFYQQYSPDLIVLGVNQEEKPELVQQFVGDLDLSYEILLDRNAKISGLYGVIGLPVTAFVDAEGILRFQHVGIMTEDQFTRYLMALGVMQ